jgi:hypothetical protein
MPAESRAGRERGLGEYCEWVSGRQVSKYVTKTSVHTAIAVNCLRKFNMDMVAEAGTFNDVPRR